MSLLPQRRSGDGPLPLLLSAPSAAALREDARRLAGWVRERPRLALADLSATLAARAPRGEQRAAVLASDREELLGGLDALASGAPATNLVAGVATGPTQPVFVIPGQGSQWAGMGLELIEELAVFGEQMSACGEALSPHVEWDLLEMLHEEAGRPFWSRVDLAHPALWSVAVSLCETWSWFGVEPSAVIGHSVGEIPAAYAAGALTLEDSAAVSALFGRAQYAVAVGGSMASVTADREVLDTYLERRHDRLWLAGVNGPRLFVVSGRTDVIESVLEELAAAGIAARLVDVAGAGHCPRMEPMREQVLRDLAPIVARPGAIPFYSSVSGDVYNTATLDPAYWHSNLCQPVLFERAVRAALGDGHRTFIEISPHPILTLGVQETGEELGAVAIGSLRRGQGGLPRLLASVAEAWAQGVAVDWSNYLGRFGGAAVELPEPAPTDLGEIAGDAGGADVRDAGLGGRLAGLPEAEQERVALELVRVEAASLLGLTAAAAVDPERPFRDLGLDSAAITELRNRLLESGLRLPATVAFDHPTAADLARHLRAVALGLAGPATAVTAPARVADDEPIAIVGIGCRYPGGVTSAAELWRLLEAGADATSAFPGDRGWAPDPYDEGAVGPRRGGFLRGAAEFDPAFFGIGPREALEIDPQQRLLLEAAWEALEDAGVDPTGLRGGPTGVFAGISSQDYGPGLRGARREESRGRSGHQMTGTATSVVSGRLAYTLGLEGPAVTIDTACSSSLVAMHLAAQALRSGECELVLAGGVTVIATTGVFTEMSRAGGLSPDGRCKAFAAEADGTGWAEGAGLLVLERLSDAQRNGRRVLAVIRGSATNQDGASNGLTAPNGPSQERVIRQALANAGLAPHEVDAVEAHGTGTKLGDPIEAQALLATYGQERGDCGPLALGSLKSNIGHTQAAAGVGGVIKMVMALREEALPRTLHVEEPTPHVDWSAGEIELLTEAKAWPKGEKPRRAGVSSFGISGTNAHLILEEAPEQAAPARDEERRPPALPWALSAKSPEALAEAAGRLAAHVEEKEPDPLDVAHTLLSARAQLEHRAVVVGGDVAELLEGLDALAQGNASPRLTQGRKASGPLAFLLTGQGAQRPEMGKGLYEAFPVYAEAFDQACAALEAEGAAVKEAVFAEQGSEASEVLNRTDLTQASLFALQVALSKLVASFGLRPDYLLGHSIGEISAAHLAGVLSLEDAAKLVAARGRLMAALPGGGAMASIRASELEVQESLAAYEGRLAIAAVNAPTAISVSGEEDALGEWEAEMSEQGREPRRLVVSHAFHSHRMEPMLAEFEAVAAGLAFKAPEIPVVSNLTGQPLTPEQATSPSYWAEHVREAVRFADGLAFLEEQGTTAYLELGPAAVLTALAQEAIDAEAPAFAPALRAKSEDTRSFLLGLGALHAGGTGVDWAPLFDGTGAATIELPTYPFQRRRYWLEAESGAGDLGAAGQSSADHPMLGATLSLVGDGEAVLTGRIALRTHPWLIDHVVGGTAVVPGTAFAELALRAGREVGAPHLQELVFESPLSLNEEGAVQLQVSVAPEGDSDEYRVTVHSRPEGSGGGDGFWAHHASGVLSDRRPPAPDFDTSVWPPDGAEPIELTGFYEGLAAGGLELGPAFQGLERAWTLGEQIYAEVGLAEDQASEAGGFGIHPALLDAALHPGFLALDSEESRRLMVLFSLGGVSLHEGAGAATLRVRVDSAGEKTRADAVTLDGTPVFSVEALTVRALDPAQLDTAVRWEGGLLALDWTELELPEPADLDGDAPAVATFPCAPDPELDPAAAAHALCAEVLERLQEEIAGEDSGTRTAFVTTGAMAVSEGESPDPAAAALWGLVRSAQSEHPGRFTLIDTDGSEASEAALASALQAADEPQLALREGAASVPRLAKAMADPSTEPPALDPEGTVLITGGLSGLGALTARHLAKRHGAKRLLLSSRRGPEAPGATELLAELESLGAEASAVACDVSERDQVTDLLAAIPAERPLTAVFHCAGVVDDGVVESLDPSRLDAVLAPKAGAAWHLHELTADLDLAAFVLYSSAAATLGNPGQANYAAANSFLDALAQRRVAEGRAATSVAWGLWEQEEGMAAQLGADGRERIRRRGLGLVTESQGMSMLDRARAAGAALAFALPLERAALGSAARAGALPPLFSGLAKIDRRRARAASGELASRLAAVPEAEREALVLGLVREQAAGVLGHASAAAIDPAASFKDLGFDSLGAVELRNRLAKATGMRLEATLLFDRPSAVAVAAHLLEQVGAGVGSAAVVVPAARGSEEPVAIVGMSCRYPGDADTPDRLWELLRSGTDAVTGFPTDRGWDIDAVYDPNPDAPGRTYTREGGFLRSAPDFDPAFFGIGPREALAMDPQQRFLLEGAWEAIEHAGIDPAALRGTATGVFAGVAVTSLEGRDVTSQSSGLGGYILTGNTGSIASGRLAYTLGLEGPAVTVDTACSSSSMAMHLAVQAIRAGECGMALAGGVTIIPSPASLIEFARQRVVSADARCKAFSAAADGTGFSEGAGILLLERLSDAQRNGHRVLATIRGSATNQDGASNGLTAPNGPSQERVIRQALANAGLAASEVDAVEAHGTGTMLGDPIEAQALLATYGQERERPLQLGSLKSNIGHTQAAAGVGGVIKMVMALREEALPKTLHVDEPTPHVDWTAGEIELLTEAKAWPRGERPRRAGISSFGISGSNVHLIIEEPPGQPDAPEPTAERPPVLPWALSAKTPEALAEAAGRLAAHVEAKQPDSLDVAHTLLNARAQLEHRAVVVGADVAELLEGLDALAQGNASPRLTQGRKASGPLAFLLTGQGAQRPEMGKGLYEAFPLYAEAFDQACAALEAEGVAVKEAVFAKQGSEASEVLNRTDLTQASLFALQVALHRLLASFGLKPDYLLGHSIGEISAAHLAGVLSLEDAAKLVAARGRLMAALPGGGAMASIRASELEVVESLASHEGRLAIAAVNAPTAISVSGEEDALAEWEAEMQESGKEPRRLVVSHAFHSHRMEPMLEEFEAVAAGLSFKAPEIPVISNLTGQPLTPEQATSPSYWAEHVREAVRFADGLAFLDEQGTTAYLELGPAAVLTALAQETIDSEAPAFAPALRAKSEDTRSFLLGLGALHAGGTGVDFSPLFEGTGAATVELPTYPFQRQRYWLEASASSGDASALGQSPTEHPLLGAAISLAGEGVLMTGRISLATHPWLADHAVAGTAILPGTGFVELALRAGEEVGATYLEELVLEAPLVLPESESVQLRVAVAPSEDGERYELEIHSRVEPGADREHESEWVRHAAGALSPRGPAAQSFDATNWPPAGARQVEAESFYDQAAAGLDYGPAFQGLEAAWRSGDDVYAEVSLGEEQAAEAERYGIHPALLDAALHPAFLEADSAGLRLPFSFGGVSLHEPRGPAALRVRLRVEGEAVRLEAAGPDGTPVASIEALAAREIDPAQLGTTGERRDDFFELAWTEAELPAPAGERNGGPAAVELFECAPDPGLDSAAASHALAAQVLERLQAFVATEDTGESRLAFLTAGAMAVGEGEPADPAAAAVWGLARSAQSEHPGRFTLIDTDGSKASEQALAAALAQTDEPQLALREGTALAPRLAKADPDDGEPPALDPEGTVLVTGGLSGLGALTARHLAGEHGARRLLLTSRRGADAPGAAELIAELAELGCAAEAVACDVSERSQVESLLGAIPASTR